MIRPLVFILCLLIPSLLLSQSDDPYRLNHKVEPVYQFIHLNLDPDKDDYRGHTSIEIEIKENLTSFRLHGKEFEITGIELQQNEKSLSVEHEFQEYGLLKILSKEELTSGNYTLSISFKGQYDKKGQGIIKYTKDSLNYLYTHFEAIHARRFFPCFDEPNFKFIYQLEITTPKDYLSFSNTPGEKEAVQDKSKTILFKKTKPTPSYLLAFATGPYETTSIPGLSIPGRIILSKGYLDKSLFIKSHSAKILKSLEDYFGTPYPYEKLDFIGIGMPAGAMENPGLVVFGDQFLIDRELLSLSDKRYRILVTIHELAHMWFGNLVSLRWWNDNWLKEGFADWLAHEILLDDYPEVDPMGAISSNISNALRDDSKATTEQIQRDLKGNDNPDEVFDALSYDKSQIVLRMVENWIGKDTFLKAMKAYFEKYKWKNTQATELFKIIQETSGKDVTRVMQDFIMQAGVPIIKIGKKENNTIILSQQRYKSVENTNNYDTIWHVPIALVLYDGKDVQEKYLYLDQQSKEFSFSEVEKIEWVHLKNNLLGYYLQILPMQMFKQAIQSTELGLYEKKDLYTGLRYSYLAGQTDPVEILNLAYDVRNTSDQAIIESTTDRVADIFSLFRTELDINNSNSFLNLTLLPFVEKIGYEYNLEESSDKQNVRATLFGSLRDNVQVRNRIIELASHYLATDVPVSFSNYVYFMFLFYYENTASLYEKFRHRIEKTKDPSERTAMFWALGWFNNDSLVQRNLDYSLSENIGPNERMAILFSIQRMYRFDPSSKKNILPWFYEHYSFFKEKVSPEDLDRWYFTMFIRNRDDLDLFNQLFPENKRSTILNRNIAFETESIIRYEELGRLYTDDLNKYINEFKNSH